MTAAGAQTPSSGYAVSRVFYPAGDYHHPPAGLLQLRVVRRGSSHARIDLGRGLRAVFTRPGDLLLTLPNSPTRFQIDESRALTLLQMTPELTSAVLLDFGAGIDELIPLTDRPFRDSLIAEISRRMENPDFAGRPLGARALTLVIGLLLASTRMQVSRARPHALSDRRLGDVVRRIDGALGDRITVEQLAGVAGMPTRTFSVAFREAMGLPVYQYVLRRRADHARELLTSPGLSLSQIAQRAGFSHPAHMNRVIKRLLGRTPAQIRDGAG